MTIRPYLVILITLWFLLELTLPEEQICPLLTNIKANVSPARVNVTWDYNVTIPTQNCVYKIHLPNNRVLSFNVSAHFFSHDFLLSNYEDDIIEIHNGLHMDFEIFGQKYRFSALPEGKNHSQAEDFSCVIYNVSIVNCSWIAGREAPKDTQYSLAFRTKDTFIPCEEYRTDAFGRQVGCIWISPNMDFSTLYYVQLVGSSKEASIRFFDKRLKPYDYVILDPPRNIRLNLTSPSALKITWEKPKTKTKLRNRDFQYDIRINGDIKTNLEGNSYQTPIHPDQRIAVSMRVRLKSNPHELEKNHSKWSEEIIHDPNAGRTQLTGTHFLIILGVTTAAVLVISIFLIHRFQVFQRLFPKVPKPKLKFLDRIQQMEISEQNMEKMEPKNMDDEDCICSQITEISKTID